MAKLFGPLSRRLGAFFREPLYPRTGFAVTRAALAAVALAPREGRVEAHAAAALPAGLVEPSFDRANIAGPRGLEDKIREVSRRLGPAGDILLLLPEACFKAVVLPFEDLPAAAAERERLLEFKLAKVMPMRPADARISYDILPSGGKAKAFVALAREAVVGEYESVFARAGFRVRVVSLPSLGLLHGARPGPDRVALVVDVEEDSISLIAAAGGDILLYRFKPLLLEAGPEGARGRVEQALNEIRNTLQFIEDREGRRTDEILLRGLPAASGDDGAAALSRDLGRPVRTLECPGRFAASDADKRLYLPLLGHLT